ncbi:MAG: TolC family protein [Bacteroidota bacterium]
MRYKFYLILFTNAFCYSILFGQPFTPPTSLQDYIQFGLDNNQRYLKEQLNAQLTREDAFQAKSFMGPDVRFNASYLLAGGGRTINFPVGDLFNPAYAALNELSGSQQFPVNIENVNEQFLPNDFHETKILVLQPLFNTDIYYGYKASEASISVADAKVKSHENQLIFQITKAYYNHLQLLEQAAILDSTRLLVQEQIRVNRKFIKYEVATNEILYDAQAQLAQVDAQVATVKKNIQISRTFFNVLLNRSLEEEITISKDDLDLVVATTDRVQVTQERAVQQRSEVRTVEAGIAAQEWLLKKEEAYRLPTVSLGAEAGFQGFGYTFDSNQDYYLLSFNLEWPIFQGKRKQSNLQKAKLQMAQLKNDFADVINQIKLDVASAYYELQETQAIYEARNSELRNAQENFRIINGKYQQNQVLQIQFNEARNRLTTAQLAATIAKYNILIAKANLNRSIQN